MRPESLRGASDFARSAKAEGGFHAADPSGALFLIHSHFPAYEGAVHATPYLRFGTLLGGGGAYFQRTAAGVMDGEWRPGEVVIIPPGLGGEGRSAPVNMVGLGIDIERWAPARTRPGRESLLGLASRLHRDEAISSVLVALRYAAETHGCSTLFFESGAGLILERALALAGSPAPQRRARLDQAKLRRVFDLVDGRLGADLSVTEMAGVVNYEVSGFSRAFKLATGLTPYGFLSQRRMDRARQLLAGGDSVTSVALTVGYSNASKFAAAFRRHHGLTPTQWRDAHGSPPS